MNEQPVPVTTEPATAPRRARHLMDLDAPRTAPNQVAEKRSLTNVQRWVASTLAVSTVLHLALGLILATKIIDNPQPGAEEMLCVMAGMLGVIAVGIARLIHGKKPLSWWLVIGFVPTLLGLWYIN
ncbi:MAG: hypothetical protein ACI379_11055 [Nocardioides sp.]|uniref:hypothetical protein n=1 Tax=Nocardioides sp. TaxID=35761 RepID=UPI003F005FD4